jgi:hypothetical protein
MDIHQFIGTVNSLMHTAGIAKAERKTVLFEHIPVNLTLCLLHNSKDLIISYEDFDNIVVDIAKAKQCTYDKCHGRICSHKNRDLFTTMDEDSKLRKRARRKDSKKTRRKEPGHAVKYGKDRAL